MSLFYLHLKGLNNRYTLREGQILLRSAILTLLLSRRLGRLKISKTFFLATFVTLYVVTLTETRGNLNFFLFLVKPTHLRTKQTPS